MEPDVFSRSNNLRLFATPIFVFKIILKNVIFGSWNRGRICLEGGRGVAWLVCEIGRSGSCPHSIQELLYSVF